MVFDPSQRVISVMPMQHPVKNREEKIEAQMFIEPWIGWRCWAVKANTNDVWLESITYSAVWSPEKEIEAKCIETNGKAKAAPEKIFNPHVAPNCDCGCGIYSVTNPDDARLWMDQRWMSIYTNPRTMRCMGQVKLWGNVIRFTKGFLAQYAYPENILVPHDVIEGFPIDAHETVHELRKRYKGVEVKLL